MRRKFRLHFKLAPKLVPNIMPFRRLVDRFCGSQDQTPGQVRPKTPVGRPSTITDEQVQSVKDFLLPYLHAKESVSLSTIATSLDISVNMAWRIVRKKLGWYPFKPSKVIPLTAEHQAGRVSFCDWLVKQPEVF